MRYALRNQDKIKAHFEPNGDEILQRIIESLNFHFEHYIDPIKGHEGYEGDNTGYKSIFIDDKGHTCQIIAFYIIEITYDVVKLAFSEFIG